MSELDKLKADLIICQDENCHAKLTELENYKLKADLGRLQTDLERMTAWAQVLANAGTAYKAELDAVKQRNEVLDGAWTTANNHRNALVEERRELSAEVGELKKKIALAEKSWNAAMEERNQWKADWKQMRDACAEQDDEIGVLKAENERLRAALAHFSERSNWRTSGLTYDWTGGTLPYKTPWNIAREALAVAP